MTEKAPEKLSFEEAFEQLEQLVETLEAGELSLEESLATFERGQALAERCGQLLQKAELKLRELTTDESGGFKETDLELPS